MNNRCSISRRKYSDPIPIDLLVDIFSPVPAKSTTRFRCVSKSWASILRRPDFTELFLTMSSTRPRLLFTFQANGKLFFYSSSQPHNPDENTSLVASRYHSFSGRDYSSLICSPLNGLVCFKDKGREDTFICNPVTGESIPLPKVGSEMRSHLGYDPIDKQFKVLLWPRETMCDKYHLLTLESGEHLWRTIRCEPHDSPYRESICINGVLYYRAWFELSSIIVCFDVSNEKFNFINLGQGMALHTYCTLVNYKGKLGALQYTDWVGRNLELWVLEDVGKHKWSKRIYVLPPPYNKIIRQTMVFTVGMTGRGEIVLSPLYSLQVPFYVFYYNLERNTLIKVDIHGLEESRHHYVYTSLDYLENVKLT